MVLGISLLEEAMPQAGVVRICFQCTLPVAEWLHYSAVFSMAVNRVVTPRFIVAIVCSVYVHIIRSVGFPDLGVTYPTLHANAPLSLPICPNF